MSVPSSRINRRFLVISDDGWWNAASYDTFDEAASAIDDMYSSGGTESSLSILEIFRVARP